MNKSLITFVGGSVIALSLYMVLNYGNCFLSMIKSPQTSIYSKNVYQLHLDTNNLKITLYINDKEIIPEYFHKSDFSSQHFDGRNKLSINKFLQTGENKLRIIFSKTERYENLGDSDKRIYAGTAFASLIFVEGILTTNEEALNADQAREVLALPDMKVKALVNKLYRRFIPETISQKNEYSYTFSVDEEGFTQFDSEHCSLGQSAENIASAELTLNTYSALKIENEKSYKVPSIFSVVTPVEEADLHVYALTEEDKPGTLDINIECKIAPLLSAAGIQEDIIQQINGRTEWRETRFPLLSFQFDKAGIYKPL